MGNYNDEIYSSINIKRALKDTQNVYDMPLQVEYGLFEDPLEIMNIMYLIANDMLASNINNVIKIENTCYIDDIENDNEQGIICHPDNYTNFNNTNQGTNNSYLYYKETNSLVLSVPNHVKSLHIHINPLILNRTHLLTYHISLQYIHQHSHVYNTNKIWHDTYLYGNPDKIIEFKRGLYQQLDFQYPGILHATFDKTHKLVIRIDNGADVSIMPYKVYNHSQFLHHLPSEDHISKKIVVMVQLKHINLFIYH